MIGTTGGRSPGLDLLSPFPTRQPLTTLPLFLIHSVHHLTTEYPHHNHSTLYINSQCTPATRSPLQPRFDLALVISH